MSNKITQNIIKKTIIEFLEKLDSPVKTICPSEVARSLFPSNWRTKMKEVREAALILVDEKRILILQKGVSVNLEEVRGPIRLQIRT